MENIENKEVKRIICVDDKSRLSDYPSVMNSLFTKIESIDKYYKKRKNFPHLIIGDMILSAHIITHFEIGENGAKIESERVTNKMVKAYGIEGNEVLTTAMFNSLDMFGVMFENVEAIMAKIKGKDDTWQKRLAGRDDFKILTNSIVRNGASILGYGEEVFKLMAETVGSHFIIPVCPDYAVIAPEDTSYNITELRNALIEANRTNEETRLSDNIYFWDAEDDSLSIVADRIRSVDLK